MALHPVADRDALDLAGNVMVDFMPMKAFAEHPLILTEGHGVRVRDVHGKEYFTEFPARSASAWATVTRH